MADRQVAPGELELVRKFVNTRDVEAGKEELDTPAALGAWLAGRGLIEPGAPVGDEDLIRARSVRECVRELLFANNDGRPVAAAAEELNRISEGIPLAVRFQEDGASEIEAAKSVSRSVDGALGRILAVIALSMARGTWSRLKVCRNEACEWAFYDHSKNHSGRWCVMEVCGNRMKARTYRRRHA